eukprot:scaffold281282_cov36-Tisochrysis_lutea.AAC.6
MQVRPSTVAAHHALIRRGRHVCLHTYGCADGLHNKGVTDVDVDAACAICCAGTGSVVLSGLPRSTFCFVEGVFWRESTRGLSIDAALCKGMVIVVRSDIRPESIDAQGFAAAAALMRWCFASRRGRTTRLT